MNLWGILHFAKQTEKVSVFFKSIKTLKKKKEI